MILGRMMHEMSLDKVSSTTKPLWVSPEDLPEVRTQASNQQSQGKHEQAYKHLSKS